MDAVDAADGGDAESPSEDGGVRRRPAPLHHEAQDVLRIELQREGGRQLPDDDDAVAPALAILFPVTPDGRVDVAERGHEAAFQFADVAGALAPVLVVGFEQAGLVRIQDRQDGPLGVEALLDGAGHAAQEGRVLEDHLLGGEDLGLGGADAFQDDLSDGLDVGGHAVDGAGQAALLAADRLAFDLIGGDGAVAG